MTASDATMSSKESAGLVDKTKALLYTENWDDAELCMRRGRAVWEVRRDEIAGTLRTTQGGSSRQAMLCAGQGQLAVRWMDVSEYAALQGVADIKYDSVSPRQEVGESERSEHAAAHWHGPSRFRRCGAALSKPRNHNRPVPQVRGERLAGAA